MTVWAQLLRYSIFAPLQISGSTRDGFSCLLPYLLGRTLPSVRSAYPPVSPHPSIGGKWHRILNRFSITYAFRLGLGPGLLWADDPSPENLRLSAGRILTCLFAYLYRHSRFCTLHYSLRYSFAAYRTLPYHLSSQWSVVCSRLFFSPCFSESIYLFAYYLVFLTQFRVYLTIYISQVFNEVY